MLIATAQEMREIDRITIEDAGIAGVVLMENAGRAVANVVRELHQEIGGGLIGVLCGKGNNGGDGFVVARYLQNWDIDVACVLTAAQSEVKGDALAQLEVAVMLGIPIVECESDPDGVATVMDTAVVYVDALFGTGLSAAPRGPSQSLIATVNQSGLPVVAVDIPTGICSDTGAVLGAAIRADVTVTFGLTKRGLVVHPGCEYAGTVNVVDIGIPQSVIEHVQPSAWTLAGLSGPLMGARLPNTHKGHYGHVLIAGGSAGKTGAPLLSGLGALRAGAGLVTVATDARSALALEGRQPELMIESGWTPGAAANNLADLKAEKSAVVVGPGLNIGEDGVLVVGEMLMGTAPTTVVVAGALTILADQPDILQGARVPMVLTPHPGEAARLLGCTSDEIQADRFGALARLVELSNAVVVLKGARTLVGAPGSEVYINLSGNAGMATAGSGDVLAGVIGAFAARGVPPLDAAVLATYAHGAAGDRASHRLGQDGLIASDLLDDLPGVVAGRNDDEPVAD